MADFEAVRDNFPVGLKILSNQGDYQHIISSPLSENSGWNVQLFIKDDLIQDVLVRCDSSESNTQQQLQDHMFAYIIDNLAGMSPSEAVLSCLLEAKMWLDTHQPEPIASASTTSSTPVGSKSTKPNKTATTKLSKTTEGEKKGRMKTAEDVISRIQWDERLPERHFIVGYLDRFTGVVEKPFSDFCWDDYTTVDDINVLAVPRHRIQYFKYKSVIVWDKRSRTDLVFGSANPQKLDIYELIRKENEKSGFVEESDEKDEEKESDGDEFNEFPDETVQSALDEETFRSDRPTYYMSIRIVSSDICQRVSWVQDSLATNFPGCCKKVVPLNHLHITLALIRPTADGSDSDAIEKLAATLDAERSAVVQMGQQINPDGVELKGLILLRDRFVAGQLNEARLKPLQNHLATAIRRAGFHVELPQNLHLTIAKLNPFRSRPVLFPLIESLRVSRFAGSQPVGSVALRAMRSGDLLYEINMSSAD